MVRIFRKIVTYTLIVFVVVTGLTWFLSALNFPQLFLAKTQKVKANLLIVEGWIPPYTVEMVYKEFLGDDYDLIITTGIKTTDLEYCTVASNGYLIFYPHLKSVLKNETDHHTIEVVAHSKMGGKYCAHFNFFVNDSLVADFNADERKKKYGISWDGPLKDIDSLIIEFDNDLWEDQGDRNLYVKEILIDNKIRIPYQFNSDLIIGSLDSKERISNNYDSNAEFFRSRLIACGMDSSQVIAVPAKNVSINRTLTSALEFRNWLNSSDRRVTGINIISLGVHSRRSWIIYRKVMGMSYDVGIISLKEDENYPSVRPEVFDILYEVTAIIYYWMIF